MVRTAGKHQGKKTSIILYISRPVRAFIARFSLALLILFGIFIIFVNKIDSPFTHSVKIWFMDYYTDIAEYLVIPVNAVLNTKDTLNDYFFVYSKNVDLTEENNELRQKLSLLSQVKVENDHLVSLLNFVSKSKYRYISAKIVGDASGPFLRSVLVNAGINDGVVAGEAVVAGEGLVGRVGEIGNRSSRVLLLTDIHSRIPVVSSISRQRAIMIGGNTDHPKLMYLPKNTELQEGEEIITSGDGDLFPSDLPVGLVYLSPSGEYLVKPYVKWHRIEHLSILHMDEDKIHSDIPMEGQDLGVIPVTVPSSFQ